MPVENTARTTLRLPKDLLQKARRMAFEENKTLGGWIREAMEVALVGKGYLAVLEKIYSEEKEAPLVSARPKNYKRKSTRYKPEEG